MIAKASLRYIHITPRKFRQILPLVKGRAAEDAIAILMGVKKRASSYAIDLLKAAIANAKRRDQGIKTNDLYISKFIADGGPMLKRFRAASMGRASMIKKRTSHITLELDMVKKPQGEEVAKTKTGQHPAQGALKAGIHTAKAGTPKKATKSKEPRTHKTEGAKKGRQ